MAEKKYEVIITITGEDEAEVRKFAETVKEDAGDKSLEVDVSDVDVLT